ncbi:hypothetical protein FACS1894170_03390 [Planctomycetales bacterium]|nr:hypothetical protein FACS1894170_03390 [Planctomycetales bacterium]
MLIQYTDAEGDIIPDNLAVITTANVMSGCSPIQLVVRDDEADWQFLPDVDDINKETPLLVAIHRIISLDNSIIKILHMECGKRAWRASIEDDWQIDNYE